MKNLILIGFMGAGKTTAGKLLAKEKEMVLQIRTRGSYQSRDGRFRTFLRRMERHISVIWKQNFSVICRRIHIIR